MWRIFFPFPPQRLPLYESSLRFESIHLSRFGHGPCPSPVAAAQWFAATPPPLGHLRRGMCSIIPSSVALPVDRECRPFGATERSSSKLGGYLRGSGLRCTTSCYVRTPSRRGRLADAAGLRHDQYLLLMLLAVVLLCVREVCALGCYIFLCPRGAKFPGILLTVVFL